MSWIRRKARPVKASDSPDLAIPKSRGNPTDWDGLTKSEATTRAARRFDRARRLCRRLVYNRERGRCQCCGKALLLTPRLPRDVLERLAHGHEEPPRSLGGDPTNPADVVLLCPPCHADVTAHRLDVLFRDPVRKAFGLVEFQPRLPECQDHDRIPAGDRDGGPPPREQGPLGGDGRVREAREDPGRAPLLGGLAPGRPA